jgi:NhaP-type Na+/H+ or K+/H+ antiporter
MNKDIQSNLSINSKNDTKNALIAIVLAIILFITIVVLTLIAVHFLSKYTNLDLGAHVSPTGPPTISPTY